MRLYYLSSLSPLFIIILFMHIDVSQHHRHFSSEQPCSMHSSLTKNGIGLEGVKSLGQNLSHCPQLSVLK